MTLLAIYRDRLFHFLDASLGFTRGDFLFPRRTTRAKSELAIAPGKAGPTLHLIVFGQPNVQRFLKIRCHLRGFYRTRSLKGRYKSAPEVVLRRIIQEVGAVVVPVNLLIVVMAFDIPTNP
jgi:hypothetical protein